MVKYDLLLKNGCVVDGTVVPRGRGGSGLLQWATHIPEQWMYRRIARAPHR